MLKHAYLILAHNEFIVLRSLVSCLDDERNDIFIHFDRKVKEIPEVSVSRSRLFILKNRVRVLWGDFSMVEAEERLFEAAVANGPYSYYHLLSGVDLPIKSQDQIHDYFQRNAGKEFISFMDVSKAEIDYRMRYVHLFPKGFRRNPSFLYRLRGGIVLLQRGLLLKRNRKVDLYKGSQWMSVTENMARLFIESKAWIKKVFNHTFIPDEFVFQTLCMRSSISENIHERSDEVSSNLRLINWSFGRWYVMDWTEADLPKLESSPAFFVRKFNGTDPEFLEAVMALSKKRDGDEVR